MIAAEARLSPATPARNTRALFGPGVIEPTSMRTETASQSMITYPVAAPTEAHPASAGPPARPGPARFGGMWAASKGKTIASSPAGSLDSSSRSDQGSRLGQRRVCEDVPSLAVRIPANPDWFSPPLVCRSVVGVRLIGREPLPTAMSVVNLPTLMSVDSFLIGKDAQ